MDTGWNSLIRIGKVALTFDTKVIVALHCAVFPAASTTVIVTSFSPISVRVKSREGCPSIKNSRIGPLSVEPPSS